MNYYETSKRIAKAHIGIMAAVERGDVLDTLKQYARFLAFCWDPRAHISCWKEIARNGFRATWDAGMRGALDGIIERP